MLLPNGYAYLLIKFVVHPFFLSLIKDIYMVQVFKKLDWLVEDCSFPHLMSLIMTLLCFSLFLNCTLHTQNEQQVHLTQPNIDARFLLQYTKTRSQLYPHLATLSQVRRLSTTVSQQMKACLEITVSKQKLNLKFTNAKNIYLAEDHFVNICRVAGKIICSSLVFS